MSDTFSVALRISSVDWEGSAQVVEAFIAKHKPVVLFEALHKTYKVLKGGAPQEYLDDVAQMLPFAEIINSGKEG